STRVANGRSPLSRTPDLPNHISAFAYTMCRGGRHPRWKIRPINATHCTAAAARPGHQSFRTAAANGSPGRRTQHGGIESIRMGEPDPALAARGGGNRLDRQLLLFHRARPQPAAARRPAGRRAGRSLAGAWRRLLPDHEVPGCPEPDAGGADLVQMGG